jgi:hypothetical protein
MKDGAQMRTINVVRWEVSGADYVDFEGGAVPTRGDEVSYDGKPHVVENVTWHVNKDRYDAGYVRCIAVAHLRAR